MSSVPDQDLDPPEDPILNEPDPDERDPLGLELIDADVHCVKHQFPLSTRIRGVLTAYDEDDIDSMAQVLRDCLPLARRQDEWKRETDWVSHGD